jgi:hypothetical protein
MGTGRKFSNKITILFLLISIMLCFTACKEEKETGESCTISVECSTILDNMDKLDKGLTDYISKDGIILEKTSVPLKENDTVYDVLSRVLKENNILMEASFTGKSAYVEGIDNIYEFSCGELSGWMYSVNGEIPMKSCSDYKVKDGDDILWQYTCDLGEDLKN